MTPNDWIEQACTEMERLGYRKTDVVLHAIRELWQRSDEADPRRAAQGLAEDWEGWSGWA